MFNNFCQTAHFLEELTGNILDLERTSPVWQVRETSITDAIIATFRSMGSMFGVTVDASNETSTGADFEIVFNISGKELAFLFQAKRCGLTKNKSLTIPELFHPHGSGTQNQTLLNYSHPTLPVLPYYALFLPKTASGILGAKISKPLTGIMVQTAQKIFDEGFRKPKKNVLLLEKHLTDALSFHDLFCAYDNADAVEDILSIVGIRDDSFRLITDTISLERRRSIRGENTVFAIIKLSR